MFRCSCFSRGSRPRGKYLAPRGKGERGSLLKEGRRRIELGKRKTAFAEQGTQSTGWSLQKTHLHPSRPSGLRKYSGDSSGTETTGGLPFPEGGAAPPYRSRQRLRVRLFSVCGRLERNYSSRGLARGGLEVGSLEVTRATGAGGVSSKRRGSERRGRGACGAGSWDTQVCGSGCRVGLALSSGESMSSRTPRVSAGELLGGRPGVGTGCWGRRLHSRPPDLAGRAPRCFNFPGELPQAVAGKRGMRVG